MQKGTQQKSTAIKVYVRVRPLVGAEIGTNQVVQVAEDSKTINITTDAVTSLTIKFDEAVPKTANQKDFFNLFTQYIPKIPEGYNLTVFAYGQTGSGKTHTMFGSDWEYTISKNSKAKQQQNTFFEDLQSDQNYAGLIPRTIFRLFQQIKRFDQNNGSPLFNIYCSFLQIYNQKIFDLLQDFPKPKALNIHESKIDGIFVQGLAEYAVTHYFDCLQLMKRGQKNRFIRQTSMNTKSSRSHTIFQILLESVHPDSKGMFKVDILIIQKARLNLCDLAGSQKINKGETMGTQHFQELKNINQSLTTLGKVIASLSSKTKMVAAFRQSKLTRLLQQSLTGNTYTFIVGNISPSSNNMDETMNTLKFVERARHVTSLLKLDRYESQTNAIQWSIYVNNQQAPKRSNLLLICQISYLKQLLNLKRKGMTAEDIQTKLVNLQQENQKLKKTSVSFHDVEKLIQENHRMKQEIHKLQMAQYSQSQPDMDAKSQLSMQTYRKTQDFRATNQIEQKFKQSGFEIQSLNNIMDHRDRTAQDRQRSRSPGNEPKQTYTPSQTKKSLVNIGQRLLDSHDSGMYTPMTQEGGTRKKEKQKILDKLQELQRIQKFNQQKLMRDLQQLQKKSLQTNKTAQIMTKKKTLVTPSTAQRKSTNISMGSNSKNVNYQQKIRQLQAKLFGK